MYYGNCAPSWPVGALASNRGKGMARTMIKTKLSKLLLLAKEEKQ